MSSDDIRRHLESATDDVTPPDDLLAGLRQRYTRRVAARRTAVIAVPLAIAVAVAVPVAAHNGGTRSVPQAQAPVTARPAVHDVAYVVKQTSEALRTENLIQYTVESINTHPFQWSTWSYEKQWRNVTNDAAGAPIYDIAVDAKSGRVISYGDKAWWATAPWSPPAINFDDPNRFGPPSTTEQIRAQLANSTLALVGREAVNGQQTLHLRGEYNFHKPGVKPVIYNLWVDEHSYLPVRSVQEVTAPNGYFRTQDDSQWFAPTSANLAKLKNHIPTGFKHLSEAPKGSGPGAG